MTQSGAQNSGRLPTQKFVEYLNEALSAENAAVDRLQRRVGETTIPDAKQQLQHHLEETRQHVSRLQELVRNLGGSPTDAKAQLLTPKPPAGETIRKTVEETVEKVTGTGENAAEMEMWRTKEDAILENAEIVSYKMLISVAEKTGMQNVIPPLKQNLSEEEAMANWIMTNTPKMLDQLLPRLAQAS